jgi:excisionase family DNA binding protein
MALLSVPQVAEHLNLSDANVRALIRRGALPAIKLGRAYRVDPDHLEQRLRALARSNDRRLHGDRGLYDDDEQGKRCGH